MPSALRRQTLAGIGWSSFASAGRSAFGVAVTVVLARLLGPDDFGLLAMVMVFVGFVGLVPQLGLGPALVQARELDEGQRSTVFWLGLALGAVLALALAAGAPLLAALYGDPRLVALTRWIAPGLVLASLAAVPRALLERAMDFRRVARVELLAAAAGGGVGIGAALAGLGATSLALQMLTAGAFSAVGFCAAARWRPRARFAPASIRPLLRFGGGLLGFQIFNYWVRSADDLLIGRFVGSTALGLYATAYRLMLLPVTHVTRVFQRVMFPALSRIQDDRERVRARYLQATRLIGLVTIPLVSGLALVADPLLGLALGERWAPVVPILRVLCIVGLQQPLVATVGWIYQSQGRTDLMFRWSVVAGAVTVCGFALGLRWGAFGVAASYAATRCLLVVPAVRIPGRLIGLSFGAFARNVAGIYACSAGMAVAVLATRWALPAAWPEAAALAAQVAVGAASFAALAWLSGLAAWREGLALLRESRGHAPDHAPVAA